MADDKKPWEFSKLQLNYPPPKSAAPSFPKTLAPGGEMPAVTPVRTPAAPGPTPQEWARQQLEREARERRADLVKEKANSKEKQRQSFQQEKQDKATELNAKYGPRLEELQKAKDAAMARMQERGFVAKIFDRATGKDAELHQAHDELAKQIAELQAGRLQEEESLNESHLEQIAGVDAYYENASVTVENQIADALDRGYFIDTTSTSSDRSQTHEAERSGGRERE